MLASYEVNLAEGRGHHGRSALIDPITRKPDWREPARRNHYSAAGRNGDGAAPQCLKPPSNYIGPRGCPASLSPNSPT